MSQRTGEVLFLRPTSGLTKYFGTWTSLFAIIGASLGTWQWMFVGVLQDMYPGISAGLTWGIGMGFMLIYTVMLTLLSMAMPRSAGIYQISARGFNPVTGILAVWRGIIANPIIKMSEFFLFIVFLGAAFSQWGAVTGNALLSGWGLAMSAQAGNPALLVGLSIFLMLVFCIIAYLGPLFKVEPRIQMIGGLFSTIGWIMAILVLVSTPTGAVQTRWDTTFGAGAYSEVVSVATGAGYAVAPAFNWTMTFLGTVWPVGLVWPYLILHYGGEMSDPAKNLVLVQVFGGIILAVLLAGGAAVFQGTFGYFSTQYAVAAGSGLLTISPVFSTGFGTMSAVLAANPVISGWILLSAPVIGLTATPINMAWVTRGFFQGSLDRVMPSFFGKLSKFHTPTWAIAYYFLFGVPFAVVFTLPGMVGLIGVITSLVGLWGIEMIFQSMAALQLPYLKKPLYEGSIRKQPEIAGFPLMSLLGIIILPLSLFVMIGFFQGAAFLSVVMMTVQYGFSALWFVVYARHLRKKNIEIGSIYESLPPE